MAEKSSEITDKFGNVIAFWLPGALLLWMISLSNSEIAGWFMKSADATPTVGGFLFAALAALVLGLLVNAFRWTFFDELLFSKAADKPANDAHSKLKDEKILAAYQAAVENKYRWYQSYANTAVALIGGYLSYFPNHPFSFLKFIIVVVVVGVLLYASYYELKGFYQRVMAILA